MLILPSNTALSVNRKKTNKTSSKHDVHRLQDLQHLMIRYYNTFVILLCIVQPNVDRIARSFHLTIIVAIWRVLTNRFVNGF